MTDARAPFARRAGVLSCDGVDLSALVAETGSPVYVYSARALVATHDAFIAPFTFMPSALRYAVKANAAIALVRLLAQRGAGVDAVSAGEIRLAVAAKVAPKAITLAGAAKTQEDLACAVSVGIEQINMEHPDELPKIAAIAREQGRIARVAVRVNPGLGAGGHRKIITGSAGAKFGVRLRDAMALAQAAEATEGAHFVGFAAHIGSMVRDPEHFAPSFALLASLTREARDAGLAVETIDIGGGLAPDADPDGMTPPGLEGYAALARQTFADSGTRLMLEPGRALVANAGALLTRVLYIKPAHGRVWALLDAGMNDFPRPAAYGARHEARAVVDTESAPRMLYDLAGPVCESADALARRVRLPALRPDNLLALMTAGAYCASMASTYNGRPLPAEVLVRDGGWSWIRKRDPNAWLAGQEI